MKHFQDCFKTLQALDLQAWVQALTPVVEEVFYAKPHGDLASWLQLLEQLPDVTFLQQSLLTYPLEIGRAEQISELQWQSMRDLLMQLHPWRKGPVSLFGRLIDTEWRSDWKWQRIRPHLGLLQGKRILDVGCGNGYYALKMAGENPELVLGIDPTLLFVVQFLTLKKYTSFLPAFVLPITLEQLPESVDNFDLVFSLGVFYHRRSPLDHLLDLKKRIRPGGELVLETLVIEGDAGQILLPQDRYAQMRNVWFLPSVPTLVQWMQRCGFVDVRVVDVSATSIDEQRSTDWMRFQSLQDFLDPEDVTKTVEGYPAPIRATLIARVGG